MKLSKIITCASVVLTAMAASSCIDKDSGDNLLKFVGILDADIPQYLYSDTDYTVTVSGVSRAKGDEKTGYGIYYIDSRKSTVRDTIRKETDTTPDHFVIHSPKKDTLTYSLTVYAFATAYNTLSMVADCIVVDTVLNEGTVKNFDILPGETKTACGSRSYYTTEVNGKKWIRQNLSNTPEGFPYLKEKVLLNIFGKYLTWEEAQTACPTGWHLPTEAEWYDLCKPYISGDPDLIDDYKGAAGALMVDASYENVKMWDYVPEVKISDASRFAAMPSGYATKTSTGNWRFNYYGQIAAYWTADETGNGLGVYRYIKEGYNTVFRGSASKTEFAAPVRCVED